MTEKHFVAFALILFSNAIVGIWSSEEGTFFDLDEQHETQVPVPLLLNWGHTLNSKAKTRHNLVNKLLTAIKKENVNNRLISGSELLEIRDMLLDDKYKPWGAASFPSNDNPSSHVILDKVDDELFTPNANSERHSYDERSHNEEPSIQLYL